jgi:hypothetical protein
VVHLLLIFVFYRILTYTISAFCITGEYSTLGHTEVVSLNVPKSKVVDLLKCFFKKGFTAAGERVDPQDR